MATVKQKYRVISADSHVWEAADLWTRYIDANFQGRAPRIIRQGDADKWHFDGLPPISISLVAAAGQKSESLKRDIRYEEGTRGGWDPHARIKDMDRDGVDGEILYTSLFNLYRLPDRGYKLACFRAYNDWLADLCSAYPDRLVGVAIIATDDVEAAVQEVKRVHRKGLRGIGLTPRPPEDRPFSNPAYEPLWGVCAELEMPIAFHLGTDEETKALAPPDFLISRTTTPIFANQVALATFIAHGICERYPKLKLISVESDIGWIAHFLARMDQGFDRHRFWSGSGTALSLKPSEYWRRQMYATFNLYDEAGMLTRKLCGVNTLMWASDYPHSDSTWPESQAFIRRQFVDIPDHDRQMIVCDNAASLYHLG